MYANIGGQIGNVIQQYGLNKEKQKKQKANIKSTVNFLDSLTQNDPAQEDRYTSIKELLLNEDISLTERDALASQGLKQVSLSSQIESQTIQNKMGRHNLGLAEELKDSRVNLAKNQSKLSDLFLKYKTETNPKKKELLILQIENNIADLGLEPQARALRKQQMSELGEDLDMGAERRRQQRLGFRDADAARALYPPSARAKFAKDFDKERLLSSKAQRRYMAGINANSKPVNTSISGNVDIGKALKDSDAKVSRLRDIETSAKDDDDKVLKISDVLVPDLYNQGFKINEEYLEDLTEDDKSNIDRLIRAVTERTSIADQELVEQVVTNPDGTTSIRLVTAAEDRAQQAEYDRLKKLEEDHANALPRLFETGEDADLSNPAFISGY